MGLGASSKGASSKGASASSKSSVVKNLIKIESLSLSFSKVN